MSSTTHTSPISPPPGHQDPDARLAASAEVTQVGDTISVADIEAFAMATISSIHKGMSYSARDHRTHFVDGIVWLLAEQRFHDEALRITIACNAHLESLPSNGPYA